MLINGDIFYSNLSKLKNLNEIIIDEDSYFLNLDLSKKQILNYILYKNIHLFLSLKKKSILTWMNLVLIIIHLEK